jgi:hypothetical protein
MLSRPRHLRSRPSPPVPQVCRIWAAATVKTAAGRPVTRASPAGTLSLAVSELNAPDLPEARIVVYTPRDDDTRVRMPPTRRTPATAQIVG